MQAKQIILARHPQGFAATDDFKIEQITLPDLEAGQVLIQPEYVSVDPMLRSLVKEGAAFKLNQPINSSVVGEVVKSKAEGFAVGEKVSGFLPWATAVITTPANLTKIDTSGESSSLYLGVLGMPGLTAYFGLSEVAKLKSGETIVISGAAGAIGTIVGQVAKFYGCKVIGIAGSAEKGKTLKDEFGYDQAINYKNQNLDDAIKEYCPAGVDVYFDNVGGEISETVMPHINKWARIVVCGQISTYNNSDNSRQVPDFFPLILTRAALVQGYHVSDYTQRFPEAIKQLSAWHQQGIIKVKETVLNGFEKLPEAFIGLFAGDNIGKMLVKI